MSTLSLNNKCRIFTLFITLIWLSYFVCQTTIADEHQPTLTQKVQPLSPEQSLQTMVLQDNYIMEIVAAEPVIEEPATMAFDGDGRIYVAEMLTYMLDADGTGTFNSISRIKRLEDQDGDGVFESFSIFADNLLLPRMILPLDDGRIIVRETNTLDFLLLTDTNGDGVADLKETVFQGGIRGGNLEHQPSGLIYGLDNWLYVTYSDKRYKFVDGKIISQTIPYGGGQWGLTQDHLGRLYYSTAGGEDPAFAFQAPSVYSKISVQGEQADGFREVFPLDTTPDVQGGLKRIRKDNTLNHFTGGGGQSIYMGGIFDDMQGDYIIAEPVGNLIRRANVVRKEGYTVLSHPYQNKQKEFIASTDPNFRPVWTTSAPDGSLMILDMYRGIIQESNWTKEGTYLREVIDRYGFDKVIGRGRLYRVKKSGVALTKLPKMYAQSHEQLIQYLGHENHWWRLEAQKLIVLSGDQKLVPDLKKIATDNSIPVAQIHALWTLEGLGVVDKKLLTSLFESPNSDVIVTAIRISEQLASAGDKSIPLMWQRLSSDQDIEVAQQAVLSAYYVNSDNHDVILSTAKQTHPNKKGLLAIEKSLLSLVLHSEKRRKLAEANQELAAAVTAGEQSYKTLCYTCHGSDGLGTTAGASLIAPALHKNSRVVGNTASLINLVLHGMNGAIDGVSYVGGMMPSIASNGDEYVANVLSYIRNDFGNQASMVRPEDVLAVKEMNYAPQGMWTQAALYNKFGKELGKKKDWKVTTNFPVHPNFNIARLTDNRIERPFFSSKAKREPEQTITIELPAQATISEVVIDSSLLPKDYSRHYTIEFSEDGSHWNKVIDNPTASEVNTEQTLGYRAKMLRITNKLGAERRPWRIQEIKLYGSYL